MSEETARETPLTPAQAAKTAWMACPQGDDPDAPWEAAAQAVLGNRAKWGDVSVTSVAMGSHCAGVQDERGDVVKVIGWGEEGLAYFDSWADWEAAVEWRQGAHVVVAPAQPAPHRARAEAGQPSLEGDAGPEASGFEGDGA